MRNPQVYLAGGMKTNWQDYVIKACEGLAVEFLDPRSHGFKDEGAYTEWDLGAANCSDCLFGYLERDNPGGHGLALEMGYCAGAHWHKIFVEDPDDPRTDYFGMMRVISDEDCVGLEQGVEALKAWLELS